MRKYKTGEDRNQIVLFPDSLEDLVDLYSDARVIDAFVDGLDIEKLGFEKPRNNNRGPRPYDPRDMLKLYLYGYTRKVRTSRKLMELAYINIEVMWLLKGLKPDFRSISDFRKNNIESMKEVFFEFNMICKKAGILSIKKTSQDGTKQRAVNAKDKNFTLNKVDDRIEHLKEEIDNLLEELSTSEEEMPEKLIKLEELSDRRKRYESYRDEMERKGVNQKSLTDKEAKLMKNNGSFEVCYNTQVQVDTASHLITNFEVTDKPADFGSMSTLVEESEKVYNEKIEINITDNGYSDRKDMIKLLENGTRPEVTPGRDKESYVLETKYEENEITEEEKNSRKNEDIKKCLRAGVIPKIYENSITKITVKNVTKTEYSEEIDEDIISELTEEEIRDKAIEENIFIRDKKCNKVYCPGGCILRQKAEYDDGTIKYCNKLGCKNCKNPCTTAEFREVRFKPNQVVLVPKSTKKNEKNSNKKNNNKKNKGTKKEIKVSSYCGGKIIEELALTEEMSIEDMLISLCEKEEKIEIEAEKKLFSKTQGVSVSKKEEKKLSTEENEIKKISTIYKRKKYKEKVVLIEYKIDKNEIKERMSTSEHCHGTMKRTDDCDYFLLKGKTKVNGEMALYYTASNIRRAINIMGTEGLIKAIKDYREEKANDVLCKVSDSIEKIIKKMFTIMKKYEIINV